MREYAPVRIREAIVDAGMESVSEDAYRELSAAIHPSEWGSVFYAHPNPDKPEEMQLGFTATFNSRQAFSLGTLTNLSLPHVDQTDNFAGRVQKVEAVAGMLSAATWHRSYSPLGR